MNTVPADEPTAQKGETNDHTRERKSRIIQNQ